MKETKKEAKNEAKKQSKPHVGIKIPTNFKEKYFKLLVGDWYHLLGHHNMITQVKNEIDIRIGWLSMKERIKMKEFL